MCVQFVCMVCSTQLTGDPNVVAGEAVVVIHGYGDVSGVDRERHGLVLLGGDDVGYRINYRYVFYYAL